MLRSLNSGVSGLQQFQAEIDVIGNNIANSNTTAFKSARVDFADSFSETLQSSSAGSATTSGTAAIQVGSGVATAAISNSFGQGSLNRTNVPTDLAVSGDGFFVVRDPVSTNQDVTRAGNFHIDQNGYLVTTKGYRVQGFSDSALATRGDLLIDGAQRPATSDPLATMTDFSVDAQGHFKVKLSDGSEYTRAQVLMQKFNDPQSLLKQGDNLWSGIGAAGPLGGATSPIPQASGTNGLGEIQAGALELSNVDLANEFSLLITAQRAFQASARMITTSDEVLQELVNLKR